VGGGFDTERHFPEWLCEWCSDGEGISGFDDIVAVRMDDEQVTDADLAPLRGLSRLRTLELEGARITDAGLKSLGGFKMLEWLDLRDTLVTEAGLANLRRMNHLEHLDLPGFELTEAGLNELCLLQSLQEVTLHGGAPTKVELIDFAESQGFDLPTDSEFQQLTFQTLRGRRKVVLVYCDVPQELTSEIEAVDYDVTKHVAYRLNQNRIKVIDPDLVYDWLGTQDRRPKSAEFGKHFNVDFVIHIDLIDFTLFEGNSPDLFRGMANCVVHVTKMDPTRSIGNVIYSTAVESAFPADAAVSAKTVSLADFRKKYMSVLSDEIGWRFYRSRTE
jgi:hypothetical protein